MKIKLSNGTSVELVKSGHGVKATYTYDNYPDRSSYDSYNYGSPWLAYNLLLIPVWTGMGLGWTVIEE